MVMGSFQSASMTKNSTNRIEPISAPKIQKLVLCVKFLKEVIWTSLIHVETKLHTS